MLGILTGLLITVTAPVPPTILPITPRVEAMQQVEIKQEAELTSTSTVRSYIEAEAEKIGVDPKLATSIVKCESGFVPQQSKILTKEGTIEESFGVWQINLPHNPEVSKEQAMDIKWSTAWSLEKLKNGKASLWSCYTKTN